jgi:hypothetical protein
VNHARATAARRGESSHALPCEAQRFKHSGAIACRVARWNATQQVRYLRSEVSVAALRSTTNSATELGLREVINRSPMRCLLAVLATLGEHCARVRVLLCVVAVSACACKAEVDCALLERVDPALDRGARFLAAFPEESLAFDAAIGLYEVRKRYDSAVLAEADARAQKIAARDRDHPMQRLWNPEMTVTATAVHGWAVTDGARVNVNRVVAEALWCDRHGLRPETLAYIGGAMRDGGGYHTTHALWALAIARERGCIDARELRERAAPLVRELEQAQRAEPTDTKEVDLFAERVLMVLLADAEAHTRTHAIARVLAMQQPDGSWGKDDRPAATYPRYHATLVAMWALAEWRARARNACARS